jgi:hypothetical protein
MAFNFNWSPLTADEKFYEKARDLLTTALNKSPKPPIIVDDILVTEFNLGSVPPELEILEIGDIAEDRFRGIFKMCYSGDAFLTLKTRVQVRCVSISCFLSSECIWFSAWQRLLLIFCNTSTCDAERMAYSASHPNNVDHWQVPSLSAVMYRNSSCFHAALWKWFSEIKS